MVTTTDFRANLADYLGRAQYGNERVTVTQHGKPVAALISYEDLELLRALEDRVDLIAAEAAIAEAEEIGYLNWDDLKAELD